MSDAASRQAAEGAADRRLELFTALSAVLTAEPLVDKALAREYLDLLSSGAEKAQLEPLLETFQAVRDAGGDLTPGVRSRIMEDAALAPLAHQILFLWFAGGLPDATGDNWTFQTPEQYFGALVWNAIGAHIPALSGGYFGYWRYPPEN